MTTKPGNAKPQRECNAPGCHKLTTGRHCQQHAKKYQTEQKEKAKRYDKERGNSNERGYTYRWSQQSKKFLKANPFCVYCEKEKPGLMIKAEVVDHITPHKGDPLLFWDRSNWQPLCKRHHDIKTAKEDGGFGREGAQKRGGGSKI